MKRTIKMISMIACMVVSTVQPVLADHPIEVERLNAEGRHLQALVVFEKIPTRVRTVQTLIAAGKSAWALGLPKQALQYFESALSFPEQSISQEERARVNLMRGVIEYQEHHLETALFFAQEALKDSNDIVGLRSAVQLLLGDIVYAQADYKAAQTYFETALQEVIPSEKGEIEYRLGNVLAAQHQYAAAMASYQRVPVDSPKAPEAIRSMAKLQFDQGKYAEVKFWLTMGRTDYPDRFLDSWVDYVLVESALKLGDIESADEVAARARASFPPSEGWMVLLEGALEKSKWNEKQKAASPQGGVQ